MSARASVVVPTHDHGPLLELAVRSALRQTVRDLEVLVIGDGADDATRAAAHALAAADERVRFFDLEKGPRHGELHRHRILIEEARGERILYLSDDDLWLPEHAERLLALLDGADFAHALSVWTNADGASQVTTLDLAVPFHREAVRSGRQTPTLTAAAHTMDAYRRLPHGWRTTPEGISTDTYMWRQFLDEPWCRAASGKVPTIVHLPSPGRRDWTPEERLDELRRYDELSRDPAWRLRYCESFVELLIDESAWFWAECDTLQRWGEGLEAQLREVWRDRARLYQERERGRRQPGRLRRLVGRL